MILESTFFYNSSLELENDETIKYFEAQNIPICKIQASLGRKKRYIIDSANGQKETVISMAVKAAKGAIEESTIDVNDIDLVIFVTSFPEQLVPCGALFLHKAIGSNPHTQCFDLNASCIGAFIALDHASKYLKLTRGAKKALIVSAEHFSRVEDLDNPVTAFSFTDSAFAMIIGNSINNEGYIDSRYYSDPSFSQTIRFPEHGFSKTESATPKLYWDRFDGRGSVNFMRNELLGFLEENGLSFSDISLFLFSQFSYHNIRLIQEHFEIPDDKIPLVCFDIGYTGASSPFLALHEYLRKGGELNTGDYLLIWTLGAGYQAGMMIWRF